MIVTPEEERGILFRPDLTLEAYNLFYEYRETDTTTPLTRVAVLLLRLERATTKPQVLVERRIEERRITAGRRKSSDRRT